MSQQVRLYDITAAEYVEILSTELGARLEAAIKKSNEIRDAYMDELDTLVASKEEAISLMPVVLSSEELTSKASRVRDIVKHVHDLTARINRFTTLTNHCLRVPPHVVRLTIEQAQEIGV